MNLLVNQQITCPYCGEMIEIVIDCSITEQEYIEDCEVCCRPVQLTINVNSRNDISIKAVHENDCS